MKLLFIALALFTFWISGDAKKNCGPRCSFEKNEVCDATGRKYHNECIMLKIACKLNKKPPPKKETCPATTPVQAPFRKHHRGKKVKGNCGSCKNHKRDLICDQHGRVYTNECELKKRNCFHNVDNKPVKCKVCKNCKNHKRDITCDQHGRKYKNKCELERYNCLYNKENKPTECQARPVVIQPYRPPPFVHAGHCPSCRFHHSKPVCDTEGNQYDNLCMMKRKACMEKVVITEEPCTQCHQFCTKEMKEVCGDDGVTYDNLCLLKYASCKADGDIQKEHEGACKE